MEDEKITKAKYNFQEALKKLVDKYKEKGVKIDSINITWGFEKESGKK